MAVRGFPKVAPFVLEPHPCTDLRHDLIILPMAKPLIVWYQELLESNNSSDRLMEALLPVIENYFDAISFLGVENWYHSDIRPANLVVLDGRGRIIDWVTANMDSVPLKFQQGALDLYLVDEVVLSEKTVLYCPKWDLISLAYSLLGLNHEFHKLVPAGGLSVPINEVLVAARAELITQLSKAEDTHALSLFAIDIYRQVKGTSGATITPQEYAQIKSSLFPRAQ